MTATTSQGGKNCTAGPQCTNLPAGMAGGIGVVMNPRAGGNAKNPTAMARLGLLLGNSGDAYSTANLDELYRVVEQFRRDRISVVGINGGDGTNHVVLTAFIRTYGEEPLPAIAFLRGGTMNTTANSCGVSRGSPRRLLSRLLDKLDGKLPLETVERDTLVVNGEYGFLWGVGLTRNFLTEYYADGSGKPTPATAVRTLVWGSISALTGNAKGNRLIERFRAKVTCDGVAWPGDYLALAAGTIDQMGLGFRPFHRIGERPRAFHALGITCSIGEFLREMGRIRLALPMGPGKTHEALARSLVVERLEGIDYFVDGDLYHSDETIRVGVGPRIRIITS